MTLHTSKRVKKRIAEADHLRLFLDYDGTLADFAPTPDIVEPDSEIISLLTELAEHPRIRVTVISGRRLDHVEELLPVPEVLLAGTYGVELLLPNSEKIDRVPYDDLRPTLEEIKPKWQDLIADQRGFFLEDKDWALALHARHAPDDAAEVVLEKARDLASSAVEETLNSEFFRILDGHKFLEIGPALANKGKTVRHLLDRYPSPDALILYVGDDDKDEEAFDVIHAHGGLAIRVCDSPCETQADARLASPQKVRHWLQMLMTRFSKAGSSSPVV